MMEGTHRERRRQAALRNNGQPRELNLETRAVAARLRLSIAPFFDTHDIRMPSTATIAARTRRSPRIFETRYAMLRKSRNRTLLIEVLIRSFERWGMLYHMFT